MHPYQDLRNRTKKLAISTIKLFRFLPRTTEGFVICKQLLRSATSVAANHRAVQRARSKAEFIAKLGTVVEVAIFTASHKTARH
jgi:four helix bundle protein